MYGSLAAAHSKKLTPLKLRGVFVTSNDGSRQKLHSDLAFAPRLGEKKDALQNAEDENLAPEYFAMVSMDIKMRVWMCEESYRSLRMVFQSCLSRLSRVTVCQFVKGPPYFAITADGNTFAGGMCLEQWGYAGR